jgi:hypothetical protein
MAEFRVPRRSTNRPPELKVRSVSWGAVIVLSGIALFAVYYAPSASRQLNTTLAAVAVVIVGGTVIGENVLVARTGLERMEGDLVFALTDRELVRRRSGWPDVKIGFSEISGLYERDGSLVVQSTEPHRKIAVPDLVEGFTTIRAELAKHSSIVAQPRRSSAGFVATLGSLLCWGVVLWSKNTSVVRIAAAIA